MNNDLLSIVIPVYNEELVLAHLRTKLEAFQKEVSFPIELVLVDDGSTDHTPQLLKAWSTNSDRVIIKRMNQNLGHQAAMQAGIELANGDYIVTMDADLQDPVETISILLNKAKEGFDIVHAQRISREGEGVFRKAVAWMFYRFVKLSFNQKILLDVGDFRLMRKKALHHYLSLDRKFMRGELIQLPFPQAVVPYERKARIAGVSKFSLRKLLALAWMGIQSSQAKSTASNRSDEENPAS